MGTPPRLPHSLHPIVNNSTGGSRSAGLCRCLLCGVVWRGSCNIECTAFGGHDVSFCVCVCVCVCVFYICLRDYCVCLCLRADGLLFQQPLSMALLIYLFTHSHTHTHPPTHTHPHKPAPSSKVCVSWVIVCSPSISPHWSTCC